MVESEKKLRALESGLNDKNKKVVSDTIISLRDEDPFMGAIGLLTFLFDRTNDLIIKDLVRSFLNDIKEPGARNEIIGEVMKVHKPETTCMLVSSCWQSGLDYSEFAGDLANAFIKGDYLTALECFTVIDESVKRIPQLKKKEIIKLLERNKETTSVEKKSLSQALITVLS
jgi:hypothetical protein